MATLQSDADEGDEMTIVKLTWNQCELISRYYEFPTAIFLLSPENMQDGLEGTRKESVHEKMCEVRRKLNDLIEEMEEI
jgi:hypothetical protein